MKRNFNYLFVWLLQLTPINCMHQSSELISYEYKDKPYTPVKELQNTSLKNQCINTLIKKIIQMKIQPPKSVDLTKFKKEKIYETFTKQLDTAPPGIQDLLCKEVDNLPSAKYCTNRKLLALNKEHTLAVISSEENKETGNLYLWSSLEKIRHLDASCAVFCENSNALAYIQADQKKTLNIIDSYEMSDGVYLNRLYLTNDSPVVASLFPYGQFILLKYADKNNVYIWNSNMTGDKWSSFNRYFGDEIEAICYYSGHMCFGLKNKNKHNIYIKNSKSFETHLTLKQFDERITDLTYSSGLVVGSSEDKTVRAWDIFNTHKCSLILHHPAPVEVVCLSPVGRYLASGTRMPHGNVYIWDLRMNKPFHTISLQSEPSPILKAQDPNAHPSINYLSFDQTGKKLVIQAEDSGNYQLFQAELTGNLILLKIAARAYLDTQVQDNKKLKKLCE